MYATLEKKIRGIVNRKTWLTVSNTETKEAELKDRRTTWVTFSKKKKTIHGNLNLFLIIPELFQTVPSNRDKHLPHKIDRGFSSA